MSQVNSPGPLTVPDQPEHLPPFLKQQLATGPAASAYLVAYSTGADSTALLHALAQLDIKVPISAVHVNHGLNPQAGQWEKLAKTNCAVWNIPLYTEHIDIMNDGHGLEAAARDARYEAINRHTGAGTVVLTAHHADDQAETLLLNLLRGSGLRGLSGIPRQRQLGEAQLFRPLLDISSATLRQYWVNMQLQFSDDSSNLDTRFDRNWLRHQLLPAITSRFPRAADNIAVSAQLLRQSLQVNQHYLHQQLEPLLAGDGELTVNTELLTDCPVFLQHELLRTFIELAGLSPPPPRQRLAEFIRQLNQAKADKLPVIKWAGHHLRVYRQRIHAVNVDPNPAAPDDSNNRLLPGAWVWPGVGSLTITTPENAGNLRWPMLEVRMRTGGEQIKLADGRHHQLKKLYQQAGIPPWERQRLPLVYHRKKLMAVADRWLHPALQHWLDTKAIGWQWQPVK